MIFNFYPLLNSVLVGVEVEAEAEVEKHVRKIFFYSVVAAFMAARIKLTMKRARAHARSGRVVDQPRYIRMSRFKIGEK